MAVKTYGRIAFTGPGDGWALQGLKPHVCIKLKAIFSKISKTDPGPFHFDNLPETCHDLLWFMERYPLEISPEDLDLLLDGRNLQRKAVAALEEILLPDYEPRLVRLKEGYQARNYQLQVADFDALQKRWLLGDDIGLGKTLEAILTLQNPKKLPALVVVQTHLPKQWKKEGFEKFTYQQVHIIKGTRPYTLPPADVYIMKYSCLAGWTDFFTTGFFKSAVFDEVQELRKSVSQKYGGAKALSENVEYCMGMSATPIYNYGDEIYSVLNLIKEGCLGEYHEFIQEWCGGRYFDKHPWVQDPKALGTYLRDNYLFLRRTRAEVGRELPPVNRIVHAVAYDEEEADKCETLARMLALRVIQGAFMERGQAARELDSLIRHRTGVSKAKYVAALVRVLLENDEPVLLAGWHRDVYTIWLKELEEFGPVMYTGTETPREKEIAKDLFVSGKTNLFIISLRSGIGLDGLQRRCRTVVIGELDWSPQVHNQVIGRVDRDDQQDQVTVIFPISDYGSDPVIVDLLGLKSSMAHGIVDPLTAVPEQYTDESRIKKLAESFLSKKKIV